MWRQLHFARHVPPRQVARRIALEVRRRIEQRLRPSLAVEDARLADAAPLPLFAPWPSETRRTPDGWDFELVGCRQSCGATVDWTLPGPGAGNQLWSMTLHYCEHAEALPDADWLDLVMQWIAANPPYAPGSTRTGWNAYAVSLRVVSWLQQLALRRDRLDPPAVRDITASAAAQLRYLERHLETDIGGNHLFKNTTALLWGSAGIACRQSARWRRTGLRLLERELAQFLPDGMHFERSPAYHAQVVADCLNIRHALGEDPTGGRLDDAIARGLQVAADLVHYDGLPALFGDCGLHMARRPDELLTAARQTSGHAPTASSSFSYPDGGYLGFRSDGSTFIVDAGPLGPDSLPGHAHGDMFAFEWSVGGERVVVDQGVFEYVAGARRQASRSAANHNTVAAPGADQGDFYAAFRLGQRTRLADREAEVKNGQLRLRAGHEGFAGLSPKCAHERTIEASADLVRVEDRLSRSLAGAAASLLLAPKAEPILQPDGSVQIGGFAVPIRLTASGPIRIEPAVWWPDMGVEIPTSRLRISLEGSEGAFELRADRS